MFHLLPAEEAQILTATFPKYFQTPHLNVKDDVNVTITFSHLDIQMNNKHSQNDQ